ncbi:SLC13 family permease [Methanolapillus millepedarum]|uniref:Transporter n=1 Tax=Methanolapillus millepedarum TaxID=3028296 RepID=A0AA97A4F8_9EURY|nr:putative transporter [Methanosarcinaceae archaeon Ac7]
MQLAVIVLFFVFILIAVRRIGHVRLPIWGIMTAGAVVVLLLGQISISDAFFAVQWETILFLFGMFVIGAAIDLSGLLRSYADSFFSGIRSQKKMLFCFIFAAGFFSAILMNDTVAIIGTPFALWCAKRYNMPAKTMLFALAAAVTTGSVASPIGNPQNLLIASSGISDPFLQFLYYLFIPTAIGLLMVYVLLAWSLKYNKTICKNPVLDEKGETVGCEVPNEQKASSGFILLTKISVVVVFVMIALLIASSIAGYDFLLLFIAVAGALPLLIFSNRRVELIQKVDWTTLLFFVSMFILMKAVYDTGFFQNLLPTGFETSVPVLYLTSVVISQFISNVPYVTFVLPVLENAAAPIVSYMTLVAGSTLAGNLSIFGAASTIIIIQNAEKQKETLTFTDFLKFGVPLTVAQTILFVGWLMLLS